MLYPLKFKPLFKERIWGGDLLARAMNKKLPAGKCIGESWELSAVPGDISVVANGKLAGNNLEELTEVYMGDLVGDHIYNRFGLLFPLLICITFSLNVWSLSGMQAPKASLIFSARESDIMLSFLISVVMDMPPNGMEA